LKSHKTSNFSSKISTTNRTYNPCIICNDHDHDTSYRRKNFLSLQVIKDYHKLKTQFMCELFKQWSHNCKMNFGKIQSVQRWTQYDITHATKPSTPTIRTANVVNNFCKTQAILALWSTAVAYRYYKHNQPRIVG
jgi:hypothetical protein